MPLKKSQRSLKDWGKQKWRTSDGSPSKGKKRYLPDAAWKSLSKVSLLNWMSLLAFNKRSS